MIRIHKHIILSLAGLWSLVAYSQINCITDPPLPPVLKLVTVQPETGNIVLNWALSPSPNIEAYIIYSYKNGDAQPLDTVWDSSVTSYNLATTATKYFSVSYVIAAMRLPRCTSILSNQLGTIFTSASIDTCNKKINVKWNKYSDQPVKVLGYKIFTSINGGTFSETHSLSSSTDNITISDFKTDSEYCFTVNAILGNGSVSSSNKSCISTKMQRPPDWINADYASVTPEKQIHLSFTVDPASEITHFLLEKKTDPAGTFQQISQPSSVNGKIEFADINSDISRLNVYRLAAINNCNIQATVSNIASNMILSMEQTGDLLKLSWNSYKSWLGSVLYYELLINSGNGFIEQLTLDPSDTVYTLNYKDIMYKVTGSEICFRISATETGNPHGVTGKSFSSDVCVESTEIVTVPNLFTPNNDALNDFFKPVLSFTPINYDLVISDRKGVVLFESKDYLKQWDGSAKGTLQPEGVYLWFLKVTTPSGKSISKTGTVTIYYNRQ